MGHPIGANADDAVNDVQLDPLRRIAAAGKGERTAQERQGLEKLDRMLGRGTKVGRIPLRLARIIRS
jgi:hypothetical protein